MDTPSSPSAAPRIDLKTRLIAAVGVVGIVWVYDPVVDALSGVHDALAIAAFLALSTFAIALALLAVGLEARPGKSAE
ncbi:MAG: hypothetical protein AAGB93_11590 [Planctomycetota bacterium]